MDDNLEVYFCDICNTSVPERDLETAVAVRIRGRVVGGCCLRELRGSAATTVARSSGGPGLRGNLLGTAVFLLAGLAGATMFLDWRLSEEVGSIQDRVSGVAAGVTAQRERWPDFEERLGATVTAGDLAGVKRQLGGLSESLDDRFGRLRDSIAANAAPVEGLGERVRELREQQVRQDASLQALSREMRRLSQEVTAALARPVAAPPREPEPVAVAMEPEVDSAGGGLSPELARQRSRLMDEDPGTRFEAVDELVQSADPAVLDDLVGMTEDADPFVRRLTVEGLAGFQDPRSVDALLTSLGDSEGIVRHAAYNSLRKLTGQTIAFDPDGSKGERKNGQRRWQDWWSRNRDSFKGG